MPNWIAITIDTLYEAKVAKLIDAANSRAKATGQPDRAAGIIQSVVNEVRNSVGKRYPVDADTTTVPKGLSPMTVEMIIARLKNAIEQELTKDESDNLAWRRRQLAQIETGDGPAIDLPDSSIAAPVEAPAGPRITSRTQQFTAADQDGI